MRVLQQYSDNRGADPSRAALKYHPDRVPLTSPERPERTKKFQQVNDAYYTLSDKNRRSAYTTAYNTKTGYFKNAYAPPPQSNEYSAEQFGDFFEEMLRENGMMNGGRGGVGADDPGSKKYDLNVSGAWFWSIMGAIGGAILGFIIANAAGMVAGMVLGNRIGAIRDREGRSVYSVYQDLPASDRAKLLSQLAARMLRSTVS
ncbi:DnaJ chaperone (Caj1), putative [Trichophyton benhamiae CBS 112371]|uniref:DnaJ chaperone (Caj1), putative n=1 Tax=Arthroderma benhamiae (strain ATCC MYA-4681 / CBS 112371) TaxID=663331 RepID=D4AXV9_ARTBC|nr:DnaJ chaperone (Caj1), putative [Trichophyton benhamiae CBS 112371]EFE32137.1 DnaJ chaperone (Caj1), putative [Trichophyton benhamiae CBS 112371]